MLNMFGSMVAANLQPMLIGVDASPWRERCNARPNPHGTERAWLVEWRFNGVQWLYLTGTRFSFTSDPNKALRFARRVDAESALAWSRECDISRRLRPIGTLLVTEHEWPSQPVPAQSRNSSRAIALALIRPECDRLRKWASVGPVQRAAVEAFADAIAAPQPAPAQPLRRGHNGVCNRSVCICERDGLGDQCVWLSPRPAAQAQVELTQAEKDALHRAHIKSVRSLDDPSTVNTAS